MMQRQNDSIISFKQITIPKDRGEIVKNIYIVIEHERSVVFDALKTLDRKTRDQIIELVIKMATVPFFRSPRIKYNLKGYNFGEIKPLPHRFFFFQKCGNNIIFFEHTIKKKKSLGDQFYKALDIKRKRYEQEFEKFAPRN